jgi:hypothetical protein
MRDAVISVVHERRFWISAGVLSAAILVLALGWWGYGAYTVARDSRAQLTFVEQLERFEIMRMSPDTDVVAWESLEASFARGYVDHSSSSLASFFLAFQAEILMREGKRGRALEVMDKAISGMPHDSIITWLYTIKRAVMRLDSDDKDVSKQGERELLDLAQSGHNKVAGLAWYHLWEYAFVNRDEDMRKLAYNKLSVDPVLMHKVKSILSLSSSSNDE